MNWLRRIGGYAASVALATALACVFSTHFVLSALGDLGVAIGAGLWLATMGRDLLGMGPLYGAIIAFGFLIAFPVASLILWRLRHWGMEPQGLPSIGFAIAGAAAVLTALLTMQGLLGDMPVAGARTPLGLAAQALAGAIGGLAYPWLAGASRKTAASR